jgi:hypothetical protein
VFEVDNDDEDGIGLKGMVGEKRRDFDIIMPKVSQHKLDSWLLSGGVIGT